ncbi:hypothetical protein CHS0354_004135 [Potamilus streckersoni]|uniref:Uncharacterized protein n=1 Tax=Potamilus streckersoni TaxID=2493646 RepID=A0AAE0W3P6_9BIVA|nr:hypothetical protein CHS0354_004135 [Potamilus streckersoni]
MEQDYYFEMSKHGRRSSIHLDLEVDSDLFVSPGSVTNGGLLGQECRFKEKVEEPIKCESGLGKSLVSVSNFEIMPKVSTNALLQILDTKTVHSITSTSDNFAEKLVIRDEEEFLIPQSKLGHVLCSTKQQSQIRKHSGKYVWSNIKVVVDLSELDQDGDSLINQAIIHDCRELCMVLICLAPNVECLNRVNRLRQTPMHLAILTNQLEIAEALVIRGADLSSQDFRGNTPLHLACRDGKLDAVRALLKFGQERMGQSLEIRNVDGLTCFLLAVQAPENRLGILEALLDAGANVNTIDAKSGRTTLHFAADNRDLELLNFLLKCSDIDVHLESFDGKTALYMAFWRNFEDVVKILRRNGAVYDYNKLNNSTSDEEN